MRGLVVSRAADVIVAAVAAFAILVVLVAAPALARAEAVQLAGVGLELAVPPGFRVAQQGDMAAVQSPDGQLSVMFAVLPRDGAGSPEELALAAGGALVTKVAPTAALTARGRTPMLGGIEFAQVDITQANPARTGFMGASFLAGDRALLVIALAAPEVLRARWNDVTFVTSRSRVAGLGAAAAPVAPAAPTVTLPPPPPPAPGTPPPMPGSPPAAAPPATFVTAPAVPTDRFERYTARLANQDVIWGLLVPAGWTAKASQAQGVVLTPPGSDSLAVIAGVGVPEVAVDDRFLEREFSKYGASGRIVARTTLPFVGGQGELVRFESAPTPEQPRPVTLLAVLTVQRPFVFMLVVLADGKQIERYADRIGEIVASMKRANAGGQFATSEIPLIDIQDPLWGIEFTPPSGCTQRRTAAGVYVIERRATARMTVTVRHRWLDAALAKTLKAGRKGVLGGHEGTIIGDGTFVVVRGAHATQFEFRADGPLTVAMVSEVLAGFRFTDPRSKRNGAAGTLTLAPATQLRLPAGVTLSEIAAGRASFGTSSFFGEAVIAPGQHGFEELLVAIRLRCVNFGGALSEGTRAAGAAAGARTLTCLPGKGSARGLNPMQATVLSRSGRSVYLFVTSTGTRLPAALEKIPDGLVLP